MTANRVLPWIVLPLAAILFLARLQELPLIDPDEGRNAEVAREMLATGSWLVPSYLGLPYLDKPALYFDTVALSFAALGANAFAARLPSVLFALGTLAMLHAFCRRTYGSRIATVSVAVVATAPLFFIFARMTILDMPLAFFTTGSILAGFLAEEDRLHRMRWSLLSAAGAAFATLVKGPVGFLVPLLVLLAWRAVLRRRGALRRIFHLPALALFLALTLPWFASLVSRHPDFAAYGLLEETFRRYTDTARFHRGGPFYYYVPVLFGVFFPWSLLLPEGIMRAWRARRRRLAPADLLFVAWGTAVVLFFSTSRSKLPGYVLTAVVALGPLTARLIDPALRPGGGGGGGSGGPLRRASIALAVASGILAVLLLAEVLSPALLERLFHLRSAEFARLRGSFAPLAILFALLATGAATAAVLRRPRLALATFLLPPLLLLTLAFPTLARYASRGSSQALAEQVAPRAGGATVAVIEACPPGLPFYLGRPVVLVSEDGRESTSHYIPYFLARRDEWPAGAVRIDRLDTWLAGREDPVYLVCGKRGRERLSAIARQRGDTLDLLLPGWWGARAGGGR
ncbi:MAG: ArnT family glycosyltransferase [Candidatus Eisenbacteria bacterium]